jgi:microcystin degradation protein MlrC
MMMHETNTFSTVRITLKDFDPYYEEERARIVGLLTHLVNIENKQL